MSATARAWAPSPRARTWWQLGRQHQTGCGGNELPDLPAMALTKVEKRQEVQRLSSWLWPCQCHLYFGSPVILLCRSCK